MRLVYCRLLAGIAVISCTIRVTLEVHFRFKTTLFSQLSLDQMHVSANNPAHFVESRLQIGWFSGWTFRFFSYLKCNLNSPFHYSPRVLCLSRCSWINGLDTVFTLCQLCTCLKNLYGHLHSQHFPLLNSKHRQNTVVKVNSVSSCFKKEAYTSGRAHTTSKHTVFI